MLREWVLLAVGLALLGASVYLVHTKVLAIKVGEHTSRLVGVGCAIVAYYYFRHGFALRMPSGGLTLSSVMQLLRSWAGPGMLFGAAAYYTFTILRNWRSEFIELITSTAWLLVVVALVIAARFVLTQ